MVSNDLVSVIGAGVGLGLIYGGLFLGILAWALWQLSKFSGWAADAIHVRLRAARVRRLATKGF